MKYLLTLLLFSVYISCLGRTITVGKDQLVTSVREGIELASGGDTVLVMGGIYYENNLLINKTLALIGLNGPVLDGENKYGILTLSGYRMLVKGFTFRNSGYSSLNDLAAISIIDAQYVQIENNQVLNSNFAIHIANSRDCLVSNNTIEGQSGSELTAGNGIHLWKCEGMVIEDNTVSGHRDGIYFEFVTRSFISRNHSRNNIRYGLHFMFSNYNAYLENEFISNGAGVAVMYSHHILMHSNHFDSNWGANAYGILLKEISDAVVAGNEFKGNTVGILMESTNRIEAFRNQFKNNGWALRIQASCSDNTVHDNNFLSNSFDVATNGSLTLNRFYKNYWDKYEGYDLDRNGVGDVPYHPVSLYAMVIEQNPNSLLLLRSFMVQLLDRSEKAIPSLTPENLKDNQPLIKSIKL